MSVVLVFDLGGTSFRAALVDQEGEAVAERSVPTVVPHQEAGRAEVDPRVWWDALVGLVAGVGQDAPGALRAVEGIAICGVTRTQVFLDRDGEVLRPALTWRDTRAERGLGRFLAQLPADHPEHARVNAFHPLARLAWLREEEPSAFARLGRVLEPKDFLNLMLTGCPASDPVSMARLVAAAEPGPGGANLLDGAGISSAVLPELHTSTSEIGQVLSGLPAALGRLAGVPVFCGASDTWAAVLGLGAMRPGIAYNISGTTEVFGIVEAEPAVAEGLLSVDWSGLHQLGGPGQNGAETATWLLRLLGREGEDPDPIRLDELLDGARDPQPLLFLPYLDGERTPYWDTALRGAFVGLHRHHRAPDLAWAVLEGVAYLNRIVLRRAEAATGREVAEIRFGGGAARNPIWCQVKADICERPIVVGEASEPGLFGAAMIAWTGLGRFACLDEAQRLARVRQRYEPDPDRAAFYRPLAALFEEAGAALAPISRQLAAAGRAAR